MHEAGRIFSGRDVEPEEFFGRLARFVAVLRSLGLRTGTSELEDAARALAEVDVLDREQFRLALRATLVKKQRDAGVFDLAFERFFTAREEKEQRRRQELNEAEQREKLIGELEAEIKDGVSRSGGDWAGGAVEQLNLTRDQLETYAQLPEQERNKMQQLLENYRGNPVNDPSNLIAQMVESSLDYWRYHLTRQEEEQGAGKRLPDVSYSGDEEADEVVRTVAGKLAEAPEESLLERDMRFIGEQDMPQATVLLRKMARRLATRLSRRYRGSRKRQAIDIRRTVRSSVQFGGIPLRLRYRSKRVQKPRLVLVCDVSASMARYARLIIQFLYGLNDVVKDIETFIFSEDLERVTPQLNRHLGFAETMSLVISQSAQWGKTTNLAAALRTFLSQHDSLFTGSTYVIFVSDAKTQKPVETARFLGEIKGRVKDVLWLITLPRGQWKDVSALELIKKEVNLLECVTLAQLEQAMIRL